MCLIPKYKTRRRNCQRDGPSLPRTNYQNFCAVTRAPIGCAQISAACVLSVLRVRADHDRHAARSPVAGLGVLTPLVAAAAVLSSSIVAMLNAPRLHGHEKAITGSAPT
jgi:hypothetical protein